jgi:hypothetical protein
MNTIEDIIEDVKNLKNRKKEYESAIEDIKIDIIKAKNDFYKTHDHYNSVVDKYATLDELFDRESDTSINKMDQQLLNIITKVFDKIISKKVDLKMEIDGKYEKKRLGLNNKGIGTLEEVWRYRWRHEEDERPTRTHIITNLETYLMILKDKQIVNKIKSVIHKKEKKEMLDTLHKYLKDWDITPLKTTEVDLHRNIYVQKRNSSGYGSQNNWDIEFKEIRATKIKFKMMKSDNWIHTGHIKKTHLKISLIDDHSNLYRLYDHTKPSDYDDYDLEDLYYTSCQVWDILNKYIDEALVNIKNEQKIKMGLLKNIWNEVSPYLMVEVM